MSEPFTNENLLGTYLRERRTKLDPEAFGFSSERRRTAGLRREEVAQRANISPTWYTWLEQGRGGSPSADVLDRTESTRSCWPSSAANARSASVVAAGVGMRTS